MFTDIKPGCPFKIKLITAINNKDQSAVIQLIETGDIEKSLEYLSLGSAAYFPMPEASLCALTKLVKAKLEQKELNRSLRWLAEHFSEYSDLTNWMTDNLTTEQIDDYLNYLANHYSHCVHLMKTMINLGDNWNWNTQGRILLETMYLSHSKGWFYGCISFLESRGVRVSSTFNNNLQWHSRVSTDHQFTSSTVLNIYTNNLNSAGPINSEITVLRHRSHLQEFCGLLILGATSGVIEPARLIKALPPEIADSISFSKHQVSIDETNDICQTITTLIDRPCYCYEFKITSECDGTKTIKHCTSELRFEDSPLDLSNLEASSLEFIES